MVQRWVFLIATFLIILSTSVQAACDGDGICEPGENTGFCEDCNSAYCGDGQCDTGYDPPETCSSCSLDCGFCNGHTCSYHDECAGGWCIDGYCTDAPECTSASQCSPPPCDPSYTLVCMNGDVYKYQNCPLAACINGECGGTVNYVYTLYQDCQNLGCTAGVCNSCTPEASYTCNETEQDIYWFDSCGTQGNIKEDCALLDDPGTWGANYCKNSDVYHNKTVSNGGCNNGDTTCSITNTDFIEQRVEDCQNGCSGGACLPGCSNDPECPTLSTTGCSLDYVNRYYCTEGTDGCFNVNWVTCTGGRCDPINHICVPGCTADPGCDDNNVCTADTCTVATGECVWTPTNEGGACDFDGNGQNDDGYCASGDCVENCSPICIYPNQTCGSGDSCNGFCDIEDGCTPTGRTCEPDGSTFSCQCPAGTTWNSNTQTCETPDAGTLGITAVPNPVVNGDVYAVTAQYYGGHVDGALKINNVAKTCVQNSDGCAWSDTFSQTAVGTVTYAALYTLTSGVVLAASVDVTIECNPCTTDTCSEGTFTQCIDGCAYPQTCSGGCSVHGCCTYDYYIDGDSDSYGDASQNLCTEQDTQKTVSQTPTDCDDNNQDIHPGMPEDCDNGIDDDCDGLIDGADENCLYIMCDGINCTGETNTEEVYMRVGVSCVEQLYSVKTVLSNPYCDNGCAYYDEDVVETALNSFRNVADGTACNSTGLCKVGVCLDECDYNNPPACQVSAPEHSVSLNFACPLSSSGENQNCYGCQDGYYWGGNNCKEETHKITNVVDMQVVSNTAFILNPVTTDFDGNPVNDINYEYRSALVSTSTTDPLTVKSNKVGTYAVTINAYPVGSNNKLASKTIEVTLLCQANRQCCPEGSANYANAGTACTKNGFPGTCDQYGECEQTCTNPDAENTAAKCSDGRDNDCDGPYDCVMINNEEETGCEDYCAVFCAEGQVACDDSCYSLMSSHDNCGACGNTCESDELCEDGQCVRYLDCYVACGEDDDCAEGICIHPGQCDAYCDNVPTIELTEEEQTNLLTSVIKQKTYTITKTILNDQLILEITNLVGVPLNNFSLTITIPKEIVASATEIGSDYPFDIVLDDPVIRAEFAEIKGTKTITYYFPKNIDPELEENIVVEAKHGLVTLSQEYMLTQDELSITRAFREDADGTTVTLRLTPGKTLSGVRIPLDIPKCLAGSVSEMNLKQDNYVIINDDPLMVWTFNTLATEEEIEFSIPRIVDDACKKQLKAFGLAEGKRTPISPWLPLAIIPIIGVILIFFQRFHGVGAEHHISKKEFFDLARQNGQEEHEIERAWYEYRRRF